MSADMHEQLQRLCVGYSASSCGKIMLKVTQLIPAKQFMETHFEFLIICLTFYGNTAVEFCDKTAHFIVAFDCYSYETVRKKNCEINMWFNQHTVSWMDYFGKGDVLINPDLNSKLCA